MKVRINPTGGFEGEYIELTPIGLNGFKLEVWRPNEKTPYWTLNCDEEEAGFFMRALDLLAGFR